MATEELAKIIKDSKHPESQLTNILYGVVLSTTPMRIKVDNRFVITDEFVELSTLVKNLTVTIDDQTLEVDGSTVEKDGQTIQIFRDLRPGDKVRLLRYQRGRKFLVLERV